MKVILALLVLLGLIPISTATAMASSNRTSSTSVGTTNTTSGHHEQKPSPPLTKTDNISKDCNSMVKPVLVNGKVAGEQLPSCAGSTPGMGLSLEQQNNLPQFIPNQAPANQSKYSPQINHSQSTLTAHTCPNGSVADANATCPP